MPIQGALNEFSVQDVLQLLELARKTGVLTIRSERLNDEAVIHMDSGNIVFASRRRSGRRLGQLLLRTGRLTQRELERAVELQRDVPDQRIGEILLEMGSVTEEALVRQLGFQVEEALYEIMRWADGQFRFEERADVFSGRIEVRVRVESLLMEGARRIDEWTRLESRVPSLDAVPALVDEENADSAPLDLHPDEWEVLAEIDARRDLRQIAANLGRSNFDVARIVFDLIGAGAVHILEPQSQLDGRQLRETLRDIDTMVQRGELEKAGRLCNELQLHLPDRADVALVAGRVMAAQGRMRAATGAFARATQIRPQSAEAHLSLGLAAVQTGDLARAVEAWQQYLRVTSPEDASHAWVVRGLEALLTLTDILSRKSS